MKTRYFALIFLIGIFMASCEPEVLEKPATEDAPTEAQLDFTIEQGDDDFHFVITNTSSVTGIANWDFGNGAKGVGDKMTVYYPTADTYTITLTLYTNGGSASISKDLEQTETDFSIFNDPKFTNISGGVDDLDGKTWVIDSLAKGHYGVGPADGVGTEWWAADPLAKSGAHAYDDELTFILTDFVASYENNGKSFVKTFRVDNDADPNYTNPVPGPGGDDYVVEYTPQEGTWFIQNVNGQDFLSLNGPTPIFPTFDTGAEGNMYKILDLSENRLELVCVGGDGNGWHYILIPKGYAPPTITYDVNATEGADNLYTFSLSNFDIPEGENISEVAWDFGDGATYTTSDHEEVITHTYMRQGTYPVTITLTTSLGEMTENLSVTLDNNNSNYVPYLLNEMVMYNDFGETMLAPLQAEAAGGAASIEIVENPDNSMYPNRSLHCAHFSKENSQWANAYMMLPSGYRFDLEDRHTFKFMVYATAGDTILFKLENTDLGDNAWQTATHDFKYIVQETNKWEVATFDMAGIGAGWDWTGQPYTSDITTDPNFNHGYYNVLRIMIQPGIGDGAFSFYFDSVAGPHVEGLK